MLEVKHIDMYDNVDRDEYCECGNKPSVLISAPNIRIICCRDCAYRMSQDLLDVVRKMARTCHRCAHYESRDGWNYAGKCEKCPGVDKYWDDNYDGKCEHFESASEA